MEHLPRGLQPADLERLQPQFYQSASCLRRHYLARHSRFSVIQKAHKMFRRGQAPPARPWRASSSWCPARPQRMSENHRVERVVPRVSLSDLGRGRCQHACGRIPTEAESCQAEVLTICKPARLVHMYCSSSVRGAPPHVNSDPNINALGWAVSVFHFQMTGNDCQCK